MPVRYTRVGWQDAPSTDTPIDAANLNHMDNGILALSQEVDTELDSLREDFTSFEEETSTRVITLQNSLPMMIGEQIDTKFGDSITDEITSWLNSHVDPAGSAVVVDDTLSVEGAAADAEKTGTLIRKNAWTGVCSTGITTQDKVINLDDANGFINGVYGTNILVNFLAPNKNTSPRLKVGSGIAYPVAYPISESPYYQIMDAEHSAWGLGVKRFMFMEDCWLLMNPDFVHTDSEFDEVKDGLTTVSNGNIYILDNLNVNRYINASTGELAIYSGWNATDFISCEGFSNLYIYSTELSRGYNAFYTSNDENSFVSNFSVAVGDNVIPVPSNAKYFRLSNSSSAISNTRVYGVVKTEVANLNAQMYNLFPGIRQTDSITWESGYYSDTGKPRGNGGTTNIRSITTDFIQCGKGSTFQLLSVANGERARVSTYSSPNDDTFIERLSYTNTSVHTIQYDCFVRLNLFYTDGSEISDQSALINNFIMRAIQLGYVTESMLETTNEKVYALQKLVPTLPADWESKVQDIQQAQGTKFTFAIQTDTHYYDGYGDAAANNLKVLTNYVGFNFVANLGDVIRGYADETIDSDTNMRLAMTEIMHRYVTGISCPLLIAMGNHDMNPMWADAYSGQKFTNAEIWGRMFRPSFNTATKAVTATGKMYYYIDYDDVRVIVLNTQDGNDQGFGISAEQLSWFTGTALNTTKWVLVLSHVPVVNGWSVGSNYVSDYANIVTALQNFKSNSGKVIGCMSGHTHTQENKTVDGILYVTFRNGGNYAEVVQIDLENKAINTISCGFNGNRTFSFT